MNMRFNRLQGKKRMPASQPRSAWEAGGFVLALVVVAALLSPAAVSGQSVVGRIINPGGGTIAGAVVAFRTESGRLAARVLSDDVGRFSVPSLPTGTLHVIVERLGFRPSESMLALSEGDTVQLDLILSVEAIPLDPIVVTASQRPFWEHLEPPGLWEFWERKDYHERLGLGSFLTEDDLKPLAGSNPAQAIADLHPFLQARSHTERSGSMLLRGRLGCKPLIWVDGRLVSPRRSSAFDPQGSERGQPSFVRRLSPDPIGRGEDPISDYLSLSQIAAVEVYRGPSSTPGEYRSGLYASDCGAVVIWSKRR
jgi:hypothetical protein